MDIFVNLNNKQTQAVRETEGYVRVIAGAGSGKTKLLVSRYAYLVTEYGIDPSNILCVTFTNKAAGEMKKRISKLIGPEYSTSLICTYHGFCARLLRENPEKLFLTRGFQIIDTYQQKTLLEEIYQKYELKLDWANFQSILKKIAQKKQDISYVSRMAQADKVQLLSEIKTLDDQIIEEYMQRQKAVYSLDFTDLMMYAIYLLTNDEEVRNKWQERLDNLSEFKRIANEFESGFGEDINLEGFLQQIALMSTEDTDKPVEAVKLMTIHASKGLEFPVVFIIGFSEGIFPSSRTIEERKKLGLEEERRLCYVAITRAQEFLYLTDSEGQSQNGIKKLPSRFLFEIGEQNYKRVGRISDDLEREAFGYMHRLDLSMTEELLPEQQSGELYVEHHIFGKGRVISFDTKRKVYTVQFENMTLPRSISADYFSKKHESLPVIKALPQEKEVEYLPPEIESNSLPQKIDNSLQPTDDLNKLTLFEQKTEKEEEYRSLPHWDEDIDKEEFTIEMPELEKNGEDVSETVEEIEITEDEEDEEEIPDEKEIPPELKAKLDAAPNHWEDPNFPKTGWSCTGVTDLGAPVGICEMCGWQIIRYVHHMVHDSGLSLDCGCVCAGKLEGNIERAKKRESAFKNKEARKFNFKKRTWKKSGRGNEYLKIKNHIVVLFHFRDSDKWKYSIDNQFCKKSYSSRNEVIEAVFEALEKLLYS